jgi:hypothetical protein
VTVSEEVIGLVPCLRLDFAGSWQLLVIFVTSKTSRIDHLTHNTAGGYLFAQQFQTFRIFVSRQIRSQ